MHRSSQSIASLAGALAKAQSELTNPEKSLVATIHPQGRGETERSFRYAPLSSGLDIVRKTLGQHEIATVQTTAIDQGAGTVNLTTVLAHSSGEWIASDWPVCAIADTATPRRMGAALTYARRYALFTLVGIAGEDDLDAPDLNAPSGQAPILENPHIAGLNGGTNGTQPPRTPRGPLKRHHTKLTVLSFSPTLPPEQSLALRVRLLSELEAITTSEAAGTWAHRILGAKNSLTAPDARLVEDAFQARLGSLGGADAEEVDRRTSADEFVASASPPIVAPEPEQRTGVIDKSALTIPEPRRIRDKAHVRFVAKQPCLVCGRQPSDAHHLRFAQARALGRKVSDEFTVPLCRGHHREVHRRGDEAAWWRTAGINPTETAHSLWLETHQLPTAAAEVSQAAPIAPVGKEEKRAERTRSLRSPGQNYKSKPNEGAGPQ
jgi:hypothetical protein